MIPANIQLAEVHDPNDIHHRLFICDFGLSTALAYAKQETKRAHPGIGNSSFLLLNK